MIKKKESVRKEKNKNGERDTKKRTDYKVNR